MKDELQALWADESPRPMTTEEKEMLMTKAGDKLAKLDRRLRLRELREILPAILISAVFGARFFVDDAPLIKLGAGVAVLACLWITYYMLRHGRGPESPGPELALQTYRERAAAKYDHQIWLLSHVKYWYVGPFYISLILMSLGEVAKNGWIFETKDYVALGLLTAFSAFVVWLNEVWTVRKLEKERDEITSMLTE